MKVIPNDNLTLLELQYSSVEMTYNSTTDVVQRSILYDNLVILGKALNKKYVLHAKTIHKEIITQTNILQIEEDRVN